MRIVFFIITFFYMGWVQAAPQVQLDSDEVLIGKPFNLIITIENAKTRILPDLTPLYENFTVLGTQTNTNYSLINGQAHMVHRWIILLVAKHPGNLTIPPLQVGNEKTSPAAITVVADFPSQNKNNDTHNKAQDLFLTAQVNDVKPYVNQQVIYTIKLYNSRQLLDISYKRPSVKDALFVALGNGRHYQEQKKGRVYDVEEQQYALFPEKSGPLKIIPPVFNALIYDTVPQKIQLKAQPITLEVKPAAASFSGQDWLPAKKISLNEFYDKEVTNIDEGATLIRTVVIKAVGVPAQLLPRLSFEAEGLNAYSDKPLDENRINNLNLEGKTTTRVTYLFNKSGKIQIPALKLPWFNINTGKEEIASLPELTIEVKPNANKVLVSTIRPPSALKDVHFSKKINTNHLAWWIVGILGVGWLMTVFFFSRKKPVSKIKGKPIHQQLKAACICNDARLAEEKLIKWANQQWPGESILSLAAVKAKVRRTNLAKEIDKLSEVLYGKNQTDWEGRTLWLSVLNYKKKKVKAVTSKSDLPPMNPG